MYLTPYGNQTKKFLIDFRALPGIWWAFKVAKSTRRMQKSYVIYKDHQDRTIGTPFRPRNVKITLAACQCSMLLKDKHSISHFDLIGLTGTSWSKPWKSCWNPPTKRPHHMATTGKAMAAMAKPARRILHDSRKMFKGFCWKGRGQKVGQVQSIAGEAAASLRDPHFK